MCIAASCRLRVGTALLVVALSLVLVSPGQARPRLAQAEPTAEVLAAPSPVVRTDDRRHLVYEIVLRNPTTARAVLERLVVVDEHRSTLASFGPATIRSLLGPSGLALVPDPEIGAGQTLTLFLDVTLPRGRPPAELAHRFVLTLRPDTGPDQRLSLTSARTTVERRSPIVLSPPLRGHRLLGFIAHTPQTIDGSLSNAQRYAIDFARLNRAADGFFEGDAQRNESYAVYGAEVHAAASGTIVAVRNDIAENTPPIEPPFTTFDDVAGNRVVQHLGGDRFALYAHLQPSSIRVRAGERVRRGDVLGLVGNTGISSGPHLHFQVMDSPGGPSALNANGIPYVFDRFTLVGTVADITAPVLAPASPPPERRHQFLRSGDVIDVP